MATPRMILLLSCAALCASGVAMPDPLTPPPAPKVWTGRLCTESTQEKNKVLLTPHKLFEDAHAARICVDRGLPRLDYQANSLRIESLGKIEVYGVRLKCSSEEYGHRFLQENEGKDVALVVGDKVMGSYRVALGFEMGCGWHQASDEKQAKEQCKAIAAAWGVNASECSMPCDKSNSGAQGICIKSG